MTRLPQCGEYVINCESIRDCVYLPNRLLVDIAKTQGGTFIAHLVQFCFGLDCVGHHSPHSNRDSTALY
jgi:hypothetical protein